MSFVKEKPMTTITCKRATPDNTLLGNMTCEIMNVYQTHSSTEDFLEMIFFCQI